MVYIFQKFQLLNKITPNIEVLDSDSGGITTSCNDVVKIIICLRHMIVNKKNINRLIDFLLKNIKNIFKNICPQPCGLSSIDRNMGNTSTCIDIPSLRHTDLSTYRLQKRSFAHLFRSTHLDLAS